MAKRGYFSIGVYHPKTTENIGTLWRTAHILGAQYIYTIGHRYKKQPSDTMKTPRHIPLFSFNDFDDFKVHLPDGCPIVAVEIDEDAHNLKNFVHPETATYLLGAEDGGIPKDILTLCHKKIQLEGSICYNVAVTGSIVLYHRCYLQ